MNLFPAIQPQAVESDANRGLYVEVAWDRNNNTPTYRNGTPVLVTGKEAVLTWAWNAVNTQRFRHEVFTWNYGNDVESLIGRPFTDDLKQAEAVRYIRECLLINPYITEVRDISVEFSGSTLELSCIVNTVYGEVTLDV